MGRLKLDAHPAGDAEASAALAQVGHAALEIRRWHIRERDRELEDRGQLVRLDQVEIPVNLGEPLVIEPIDQPGEARIACGAIQGARNFPLVLRPPRQA